MTNNYTPQDKSAANIRHKMQKLGESIVSEPSRSSTSKKVYGSSLANTVHQNYALGVKELKDQLDAKGGTHLSTEVLQSAMRGLVSAALWDRIEDFYDVLASCESPAEELFVIALDTVLVTRSISIYYQTKNDPGGDDSLIDSYEAGDEAHVVIEPQGAVWRKDQKFDWDSNPYRADFLITCTKQTGDHRTPIVQTRTAVEIDGRTHATDESRSHDNERDRIFRELNIATDRYTGVDILADPFACAQRAVNHFLSL
jgi:hypothetical protein